MAEKLHIASCSFGKDSIVTILLALEHNEPLDRVVFAEVMFDHQRGISAEIPEHIEWIYSTAIPKLESMGVKVDVVKSERDYLYFFANAVRGGARQGKIYGFPIGGKCFINRDCKVAPIRRYLAELAGSNRQVRKRIVQYIGIAADEPQRQHRLSASKISLLVKYGYTEEMAREKCREYGLLSPVYEISHRGGCWFCPNCRIPTLSKFRASHPDLWEELRKLSKTPNLCSYGFKYGKTVEEIDKILDFRDRQLTLF